MEFESRLHQLLVQWRDGEIEGARIVWQITTISDGVPLSCELLPPQPLSLAGNQAYTSLSGVLSIAQVDTFKRLEETLELLDIVQRDNHQLHQMVKQLIAQKVIAQKVGEGRTDDCS